ncbi:uncharacterized protein LOC111706207 isoform X2 [Eurytemora carolleeae]|uniref:uncharacterized protein LOC111706207 isoform X2 n=1 Tax=Eurytemora carolleeae TaxID=1294199 RepID=UPI000C78B89D|nr:uncharacterized protein LOC111706207 isoform X2 [Eurytemora carolleeae]|eukprot:XP_023334775.1 uncharacterized protein LOC111706207 isoform X2 [Eurytemora affinis]
MLIRLLVLALSVLHVCGAGILPLYMLGEYEFVSDDNYDNFLYEIGVGVFQRRTLTAAKPSEKIRESGDFVEIAISTDVGGRIIQSKFKLGSPYVELGNEGEKIPTLARLEGNKLIKLKKPDDLNIEEEREFLDDGNTMNLHLRLLGKPDATAVRVFKKKGSGNFNAGNSFQNDNIRENEDYKYGTNFEDSQDDFQNSDTFLNKGAKQSINDNHQSNSGTFSQNEDYEYQNAFSDVESDFSPGQTDQQRTEEKQRNSTGQTDQQRTEEKLRNSTGQTDQQRTEEKLRNSPGQTDQQRTEEKLRNSTGQTDQQRTEEKLRNSTGQTDQQRTEEKLRNSPGQTDQQRTEEKLRNSPGQTNQQRTEEKLRNSTGQTDQQRNEEKLRNSTSTNFY